MQEKITIERFTHGDAAIGHTANGKAIFVEDAVPGDTATVEILEDKGSYYQGRVIEVLEPSVHRVKAPCPYAGICGGCSWQASDYDLQLEAKRDDVLNQLIRIGGIERARADSIVGATVPSKHQIAYRNKLEFQCQVSATSRISLGMSKSGTNDVVDIDCCLLGHKQIQQSAKALRGALRFAAGNQDLGIYRVGIRHSERTKSTEVALWTRTGSFPRNEVAKVLGSALKTTSIVRVMTSDTGKQRKLKGVETLSGKGFWEETVCGITHRVSGPSFFQVNTAQAEKLVSLAIEGLGLSEGDYVADLYCGVGTFTIPLAQHGCDVAAVESYGSSVRDLRRTSESLGLDIDVIGGDAARELPGLGSLDALVVDPPRAGLDKTIIRSIAEAGPRAIAYVSCNPSSLARDIARLESAGYRLESATPVDMFPQTYHVETVACLRKA